MLGCPLRLLSCFTETRLWYLQKRMALTHLPTDRENIRTPAVLLDKWRLQGFQSSLYDGRGHCLTDQSIMIDGKECHILRGSTGMFIIIWIKSSFYRGRKYARSHQWGVRLRPESVLSPAPHKAILCANCPESRADSLSFQQLQHFTGKKKLILTPSTV